MCIQRSQKGQRDHHTEITISSSSWLVPSSVIHKLVALLSGRSSQLSISIAQSLDSHPPTSSAHTLKADVLTNILPSQHFHILEFYSLSPWSVYVSVFTCTSKCSSLISAEIFTGYFCVCVLMCTWVSSNVVREYFAGCAAVNKAIILKNLNSCTQLAYFSFQSTLPPSRVYLTKPENNNKKGRKRREVFCLRTASSALL